MSWLGLADKTERRFSLRGIGHDRQAMRRHPDADTAPLDRGSIVFEARVAAESKPHILCGFEKDWPQSQSLYFFAIPGGGVSIVQNTGKTIAHAAIQHAATMRIDRLRVTFSWDCTRNWAQLSVERPEARDASSVLVRDVQPISLADIRGFILGRDRQTFSPDMIYAAVSDEIEPVGPSPSVGLNAMVATQFGYKPAHELQRGDTVISGDGDIVPILHRIDRTVPARGSFEPTRLRAPYFGLLEDVVLSPEQRLVVGGSEVEYLFNQEAVLVAARHLADSFVAAAEPSFPTAQYTQFILPEHSAIMAAGIALESLYIGRLRRKKEKLETTVLKNIDRQSLPEHGRSAHMELNWHDAVHLANQRAA